MRILTLSDCPALRHQGSGYVIHGFDEHLRELGHSVVFVGPDVLAGPSYLGNKGRSHRITLGMARKALQATRSASTDVLHMYGEECWLACALLVNRKKRPAIVHHSNGVRPHWYLLDPKARPSNFFASKLPLTKAFTCADLVVTVSEFDRQYLIKAGLKSADRVLSIPNSLEDKALKWSSSQLRKRTVLYVGSWIKRKGIDAMYRNLPTFLERHPEYSFRAIGLDNPEEVLNCFPESLRHRLILERPSADRNYIYEAMSVADIQIVPSAHESFGLVTAEAMRCGTIVLATPRGFAADFSDGDGLFIIGEGSDGLLDAIERAIIRRPGWNHVRECARNATENLRWESAGRTLSNAFESLVSKKPQTS